MPVTRLHVAGYRSIRSLRLELGRLTVVVGPFNKTEFFFGAGEGMHSNDARGATITEDPTDPTTKLSASPRP